MNFVEAGYELDAYWPRLRFCVELDVYETHGSRIAFERDRVRRGARARGDPGGEDHRGPTSA
jgi:hypothetical protein